MKTIKQLTLMTAVLLLLTSFLAHAEIASGTYYNDFTGTVPVWDISGSYSGDVGLGLGLDFSISEDASGNFVGTGTFLYDDGQNYLDGDINVYGKVTGTTAAPHVAMTILIAGGGTVVIDQLGNTDDVTFDATAKIAFGMDSNNGQLVVTGGSAKVTETSLSTGKTKRRGASLGKGATMDLPVDSYGGWDMSLNLTPNGTKYTGTATIGTSAGGTADFTVTGTYSAKTDTSSITLKGTGGTVTMVVSTSGSEINIHSVKGKLFGQTLK